MIFGVGEFVKPFHQPQGSRIPKLKVAGHKLSWVTVQQTFPTARRLCPIVPSIARYVGSDETAHANAHDDPHPATLQKPERAGHAGQPGKPKPPRLQETSETNY
jgi:hypothetical protein